MAFVGSMASQLRKTVKSTSPSASTPEESKARKSKLLNILDVATNQFLANLEDGKISLTNTADFERIVKLTLLLQGEANNINATEGTEEVTTAEMNAVNLNIDKITDILDNSDPEVKAMYDKIFNNYNTANDNYEK